MGRSLGMCIVKVKCSQQQLIPGTISWLPLLNARDFVLHCLGEALLHQHVASAETIADDSLLAVIGPGLSPFQEHCAR